MRRVVAICGLVLLVVAGCGSDDESAPELGGWVREPLPEVGSLTLPDVAADGAPFAFRAPEGGLLLVYFGFTACPDICPTTMSDVQQALADLGDDAGRVEVALVTVDPGRDTAETLDRYLGSFVAAGGHPLRTDDAGELRAVADVFGADYTVETDETGRIDVGHTAHLYAVDDAGRLLVTWPFATPVDTLVDDLRILLSEGIPTT